MSYPLNAPASSERSSLSPVRFVIEFAASLAKYLATLIAAYLTVLG